MIASENMHLKHALNGKILIINNKLRKVTYTC